MVLTPSRRRTTNNSSVLRPANESGSESDNSIVTEPAVMANAQSQTDGDASADPDIAPDEQVINASAGGQIAIANNRQANAQQLPTTITMDNIIPRIQEVSTEEVLEKLPIQILMKIKGEPTYGAFYQLREGVTKNMLKIYSSFGGGQHDHW